MSAKHGEFDKDDNPAEDKSTLSAESIAIPIEATVFRFFDLPRELRDRIYDFSNKDLSVSGARHGLCAVELRLRVLSPQLLRVSRRFKQECEDLLLHDITMRYIRMIEAHATSGDSGLPMPVTLRGRLTHNRAAHLPVSAGTFTRGADRSNRLGQDIASLLALMPRMDEIQLEVVLSADHVEPLVNGAYPLLSLSVLTQAHSDNELFALCPKDRIASITVRQKLTVCSTLFSARQGAFDDRIFNALEGPHDHGNTIFFETSASDGPYAWCGLDLEVSSPSPGSLEKAFGNSSQCEERHQVTLRDGRGICRAWLIRAHAFA